MHPVLTRIAGRLTAPAATRPQHLRFYRLKGSDISMPTYVYECTKCEHQFELVQKITDAPKKRCPSCRSKIFRVISGGGGVILKGSGFYVTDYRSGDYAKSERAEKSEAADKPETPPAKSKSAAG
jgi:putative FmdB family regulatory protein